MIKVSTNKEFVYKIISGLNSEIVSDEFHKEEKRYLCKDKSKSEPRQTVWFISCALFVFIFMIYFDPCHAELAFLKFR